MGLRGSGHPPLLCRRYYRRLLQTGVQTTELWSNLGLCTFYSGQCERQRRGGGGTARWRLHRRRHHRCPPQTT